MEISPLCCDHFHTLFFFFHFQGISFLLYTALQCSCRFLYPDSCCDCCKLTSLNFRRGFHIPGNLPPCAPRKSIILIVWQIRGKGKVWSNKLIQNSNLFIHIIYWHTDHLSWECLLWLLLLNFTLSFRPRCALWNNSGCFYKCWKGCRKLWIHIFHWGKSSSPITK